MKQARHIAKEKNSVLSTDKALKKSAENADDMVPIRIVGVARQIFDQHGFVRVTMEEIASEARISKKTLYKYFPNKEALVRGVVHAMMEESAARFEPIIGESGMHFLERLQLLMHAMSIQSASVSSVFIQEVGQLRTELWMEVEQFRSERLGQIECLIRQGVEEGYIRSDVDVDLVVRIFMTVVQTLLSPQVLRTSKHGFPEILDGLMTLLFEGMLTTEGRKRVHVAGKVRGLRKLQLNQSTLTLMLSPSLRGVLSVPEVSRTTIGLKRSVHTEKAILPQRIHRKSKKRIQ